jgi:hypothetical protein
MPVGVRLGVLGDLVSSLGSGVCPTCGPAIIARGQRIRYHHLRPCRVRRGGVPQTVRYTSTSATLHSPGLSPLLSPESSGVSAWAEDSEGGGRARGDARAGPFAGPHSRGSRGTALAASPAPAQLRPSRGLGSLSSGARAGLFRKDPGHTSGGRGSSSRRGALGGTSVAATFSVRERVTGVGGAGGSSAAKRRPTGERSPPSGLGLGLSKRGRSHGQDPGFQSELLPLLEEGYFALGGQGPSSAVQVEARESSLDRPRGKTPQPPRRLHTAPAPLAAPRLSSQTHRDSRASQARREALCSLKQALFVEADRLAQSCPYCLVRDRVSVAHAADKCPQVAQEGRYLACFNVGHARKACAVERTRSEAREAQKRGSGQGQHKRLCAFCHTSDTLGVPFHTKPWEESRRGFGDNAVCDSPARDLVLSAAFAALQHRRHALRELFRDLGYPLAGLVLQEGDDVKKFTWATAEVGPECGFTNAALVFLHVAQGGKYDYLLDNLRATLVG